MTSKDSRKMLRATGKFLEQNNNGKAINRNSSRNSENGGKTDEFIFKKNLRQRTEKTPGKELLRSKSQNLKQVTLAAWAVVSLGLQIHWDPYHRKKWLDSNSQRLINLGRVLGREDLSGTWSAMFTLTPPTSVSTVVKP
jgi:hypothetical protein